MCSDNESEAGGEDDESDALAVFMRATKALAQDREAFDAELADCDAALAVVCCCWVTAVYVPAKSSANWASHVAPRNPSTRISRLNRLIPRLSKRSGKRP